MRSGWSSGSIYSVLLVSGWFSVSKTIIPDAQEHFLTPSARRDIYLFGGFGLRETSKRSCTNLRTTFQFQLAKSRPTFAGNSCTTAFSSVCCTPSITGGNHPTARSPSPPDRPRRRRQPTGQWYGHPVPAPRPPPPQSSLGPKAIGHATVPAPGVSAPSTFAAADHQHPVAIVPETPAYLSYPTPTPLCFPSRLSHLLPSFT